MNMSAEIQPQKLAIWKLRNISYWASRS